MKAKIAIFLVLATLVGFGIMPVCAQEIPPIPHAFYGTVEINGQPSPIGTQVEARGDNVTTGIEGNPIITTQPGKYGGPGLDEPKLIVRGFLEEETTITFYVNNVPATQTYPFHSGEVTELDLTVTVAIPMVTLNSIPTPTNDVSPTFTGTASSSENNIASVEYNLDEAGWTATSATDGAFNNLSEEFTFTTPSLTDGSHTVWVRAKDAAAQLTPEANYASQTFSVDTAAPIIVSTSPANAASGVSTSIVLGATFNEDIDRASLVFTLNNVAGTVLYNKADFSASFAPEANLNPETEYTASISARDAAGNPMPTYTWGFTTTEAPSETAAPSAPSSPSPVNGATNITTPVTLSVLASDPNGDNMTITFYDRRDKVIGTATDVASGTRASVAWSGLDPGKKYSWYAKANDGELDGPKSSVWSFTTKGAPSSSHLTWYMITIIALAVVVVVTLIVIIVRRRRSYY